ncbi:chromate transporter [Schnuerera ultunensis]|uniref:Chromate transport protein n=1 Tax=[Clostridium] ultunense Esp TaxID=1288971 RepID=A0A1M4PM92_9FIRM|nr:chromate transporter [Schnuerera ultunensis]SHD76571.1 Chromate transport protein [[Clostridium] ultunense Esp]
MLFDMFKTFFKVGAFTIGGGYAMIPIIQKEIVDNKNWIKEEEFLDIIAVSQGSPGPIAVNVSIFVGYKLKGFKGALACTLGTTLPSFLIILLIATVFFQFRNNPIIEKVFLGIRPAVVALIVSAVYQLAKKSKFNYKKISISVITALLIVFLSISPIYLILIGGIGSILYYKNKETEGKIILYNIVHLCYSKLMDWIF